MRNHSVIDTVDPSDLIQCDIVPIWITAATHFHTCHPASIPTPRSTALTSVLPPTVEGLYLAKSVYKLWKRRLLLQMYRHLQKATGIMENQGSMISPKEQSKLPVADLKK